MRRESSSHAAAKIRPDLRSHPFGRGSLCRPDKNEDVRAAQSLFNSPGEGFTRGNVPLIKPDVDSLLDESRGKESGCGLVISVVTYEYAHLVSLPQQ